MAKSYYNEVKERALTDHTICYFCALGRVVTPAAWIGTNDHATLGICRDHADGYRNGRHGVTLTLLDQRLEECPTCHRFIANRARHGYTTEYSYQGVTPACPGWN